MKTTQLVPLEIIEERIFLIRGQKVMLGYHLANLYDLETRVLMQAVKRNIDRFPEDFMLQLSKDEIGRISQIVTSLKYSKVVYAFTEQGVAMLSSVLRSSRAIQMNIVIIRAFVNLRRILATHTELALKLKQLETKMEQHDKEIISLFAAIRKLMEPPPEKPKRPIGFIVEEPKPIYRIRKKK
jgi:hypothetical protein